MIKNFVHYVGFLMLIVFMLCIVTPIANADNSIKKLQEIANPANPNIEETTTFVQPRPETELQLFMVLYRQTNICQATMINLGKNFSASLAIIKNIDPSLPVVAQLETLLAIAQTRYTQLTQMEQQMVAKLRTLGVNDNTLGTIGGSVFNEAINYGMRVHGAAHASPETVEGFIATLLQQNVQCEGGIQASLDKIKALNAPPTAPPVMP